MSSPTDEITRQYVDELRRHLPDYARRAAEVPEGANGSVEWLRKVGNYWCGARRGFELTRKQASQALGISFFDLRFLEFGVREFDPDVYERYAQALGRPQFFTQFQAMFGPIPSSYQRG